MHKMAVCRISAAMDYEAIAARVFGGEVLLFDGLNAGGAKALIARARELCRDVFEVADLEKAHEAHSRNSFLRRAAAAQEMFDGEPYKTLFADFLRRIGIANTDDLFWDSLGLRIAPPINTHAGGFRSTIGVHRDTWGAALQSQINWWAPITPLAYKRTLAFYPDYWTRPLANTTDTWRFADYLASRRDAKTAGRAAAYPSAPQNTEQPSTPPHLARPACGQALAFSAAHLHSSVTNRTSRTRFSLEIRTVLATHEQQNRGAPNVDCHSAPPLYGLFRALTDPDHSLKTAMSAAAYGDDQTAQA